jgi:hypothetical protein
VAQYEVLTDRLAARAQAAVETPATNMLLGNTEEGLAQYIDENSTDPDLQAALLPSAKDVDRQVLAPNYRAYLQAALGNGTWAAFFAALSQYVTSEAGGSYASLAAWLSSSGAKTHPVAAEILRLALGENSLLLDGALVGAMHPEMEPVSFDKVYTGAMGSLADDTTDAGDADTADVALFAADDDVVVLQSRHRFNRILAQLSTLASADVALDAYYWNGADWTALVLTDLTTGLSVNGGMISWTLPTDWVPCNHDMDDPMATLDTANEGALYTVILQRTEETVETPPVATWLKTIPEEILTSGSSLFGVAQPPLALVRVTGTNTCEVTALSDAAYDRFECPGTANSVLKLLAITAFSDNITFTLGYTDQAGNAATKAQSAWTAAIAAGDTKTLALDTGDTGIRSVAPATCAITTAATSGIFLVVADGYARAINAK